MRQFDDNLRAAGITILQINAGKFCNQACKHCHVDAGPGRREIMNRETAELCMRVLERTDIPTLDITGGAPELNPNFRWIVERAASLKRRVIDRCNLTVLMLPSQAGLAEFLAAHRVEIVASLPCYTESNTDLQRGAGVFRFHGAQLERGGADQHHGQCEQGTAGDRRDRALGARRGRREPARARGRDRHARHGRQRRLRPRDRGGAAGRRGQNGRLVAAQRRVCRRLAAVSTRRPVADRLLAKELIGLRSPP